MDVLLRHKLKAIESPIRATTCLNPFDPPLTLIKIWDNDSHTLYTKSLGFRCGNWKKCQPADDFIELKSKELLKSVYSRYYIIEAFVSFAPSHQSFWFSSKIL